MIFTHKTSSLHTMPYRQRKRDNNNNNNNNTDLLSCPLSNPFDPFVPVP